MLYRLYRERERESGRTKAQVPKQRVDCPTCLESATRKGKKGLCLYSVELLLLLLLLGHCILPPRSMEYRIRPGGGGEEHGDGIMQG